MIAVSVTTCYWTRTREMSVNNERKGQEEAMLTTGERKGKDEFLLNIDHDAIKGQDEAMLKTDHDERKGKDEAMLNTNHDERNEQDEAMLNTNHNERKGQDEAMLNTNHNERKGKDEAILNTNHDEIKGQDEAISNTNHDEIKGQDEAMLNTNHDERKGQDDAMLKTDHDEKKGQDEAKLNTNHNERKGHDEVMLKTDHDERKVQDKAMLKTERKPDVIILSPKPEQMKDKSSHFVTIDLQDIRYETTEMITATNKVMTSFYKREKKAFKKEKSKDLRNYSKVSTKIDFDELKNEFKVDGGQEPRRHWHYQAQKRNGEKCPELLSTVLIGIIFTLIPNCAIVLDYTAAYEYLTGTYYIKNVPVFISAEINPDYHPGRILGKSPLNQSADCHDYEPGFFTPSCENCKVCFEKDEIYGILTLVFNFLPGIFWSSAIFNRYWNHLVEKDRDFYDRKRMFVFCYIPLLVVSIVTFPLQLVIISLISVFNDQYQWSLLTARVGIAEGLFNSHAQFLLQMFIFLQRADRHPSTVQYMLAFGSLVFLSYSRVESLLLVRKGHSMSFGQKLWWTIRYIPGFILNCGFKLGSMSLVAAILSFNFVWIYGSILIIWVILQILFNEQVIPRRYYYLFLGAGAHAFSVAHVQEEIKLVDAKLDPSKNIMYSTKLTSRQLKRNLRFQNMFWFVLNSCIIIIITVVSNTEIQKLYPILNTKIQAFWPFTPEITYSLEEIKVFKHLQIIVPVIISIGVLSQIWIWKFEERSISQIIHWENRKTIKELTDHLEAIDQEEAPKAYEGWTYVDSEDCQGQNSKEKWHKYEYSNSYIEKAGAQSKFLQIVFPLFNIWENFGDKNTTQM